MKVKLEQYTSESNREIIVKEIYLDGYLKSNLDIGIDLQAKDWDQVWLVDGDEGSGKTNLSCTCAYYVSPMERRHSLIDRIVTRIEEADKIILQSQRGDSIVIDEAFGGMSAGGFMSKINRLLQRRFVEIRAKNLFVFIVAPTFMDLQRYFAIWRTRCLLHVYHKSGSRGYCAFFNEDRKKKLYIKGKKEYYNYNVVAANFVFRFIDEMPKLIDKEKYDKKKRLSNLTLSGFKTEADIARDVKADIVSRLDDPKIGLKPIQKIKIMAISEATVKRYRKLARENAVEGSQDHN